MPMWCVAMTRWCVGRRLDLWRSHEQEYMLDYTFQKLGIDTDRVEHPLLLTETLCNPEYSRSQLNELLFEAYNVQSVNYGMDALFAAYANGVREHGLVVSSGRSSTVVVPMVDGRGLLSQSKRLAWGGAPAVEYLQRLLQLKYPTFPQRITTTQTQTMLEELCYVSPDYDEEIASYAYPEALASVDRVVQLPYAEPERREKTQEELDRIAERKRAASQRLTEQTRIMRQEKAQQKENDLQYYRALREWKERESPEAYAKRVEAEGFENEQELDRLMKRLEASVRRAKAIELGLDPDEEKKPPSFPLVDVPDAELDEEGIKEKRRQRLLKAGYDARMRAQAEREEQRRLEAEAQAKEEQEQRENPEAWAARMRQEHAESIARLRERKRLREMLPDRKSAAAQQRMRSITALASEQNTSSTGSQRRRKRGEEEDTFGADDNDWSVYRTIQDAEDSEEEREEMSNLERIEEKLLQFDPRFEQEDTYGAMLARKTRLTNTFLRGFEPKWDPEDVAQYHQVHLNVERIRVPEVSWQPVMAGVDQAGVGELASFLLRRVDDNVRGAMARNVLLTGRYTNLPGFDTRLVRELRAILPPGAPLSVRRARNTRFDPWLGMRQWVSEQADAFRASSVTRAEYEEKGSGWFKEHALSAAWPA